MKGSATRKEFIRKEKPTMSWSPKQRQKGCQLEGKADQCM